jgi:hypothetical protein
LEHQKVTTDLNPSIPRKLNQDELLRQQVAQVLRKLELEVSQNKFEDILTKDRAKELALSTLNAKDKQFIEEID